MKMNKIKNKLINYSTNCKTKLMNYNKINLILINYNKNYKIQ